MTRPNTRSIVFLSGAALLTLGLVGCQSAEPPPEMAPPDETAAVAAPALNTLTAEEKADGWRLLLDGTDLSPWRGYRTDEVPAAWAVEDGVIFFAGEGGGEGGGDLLTREQFADFELALDFKVAPGSNSGILYRVTEDYEEEYMTGPEFQVAASDPTHPKYNPKTSVGSNYDFHAPTKDIARPVGEWNAVRLVVNGAHVEHWMNGEKIVEFELWTDEWKAMVAETKFAKWPGYGMNEKGHIALQDHGKPVWYRNIKIKPLNEEAPAE